MASRIDAVESARTGESDEQDVWTWEGEFGEGSRRRGMREWGELIVGDGEIGGLWHWMNGREESGGPRRFLGERMSRESD